MVCNGFEVTTDECFMCTGTPKTKMTIVNIINQKWADTRTLLKRRNTMNTSKQKTPYSHEDIVTRLDLAKEPTKKGNRKGFIAVGIAALIMAIVAGARYINLW